jgi:hypothetical protein
VQFTTPIRLAEDAIKEPEKADCDGKRLSITAKDFLSGEQVEGYCDSKERGRYWSGLRAFFGG